MGIAHIKQDNRYVFYLIVKKNCWQKPTHKHLFKILLKPKIVSEENYLTEYQKSDAEQITLVGTKLKQFCVIFSENLP